MGLFTIDIRRNDIARRPDSGAWRTTPFQTEIWLDAWQRDIGSADESEPITVTGAAGDAAAFILPLSRERRMGATMLTPLAIHHGDYGAPLLNAECATALAAADGAAILRDAAARIGGIDLIYLAKQPRNVGGLHNPFVLPGSFDYHAGAHAISFTPGQSFDDFLFTRRSSKTRRRLREKRAALEKTGPVSFRMAQDAADARGLIGACLTAKSAQLKRLGHYDPFSEMANRGFLIDVFSSGIGSTTWAAALDVAGETSVTSFGFRMDGEWLLYQMAMAEGADQRNSPGTHHLMELIRHCIGQDARLLDLSLGDESYKAEWCDVHSRLAVSLLPLTARGWAVGKLIEARGRTRLRMAADPRLYDRAKKIKGLLQIFRLPL